MADNRYGYGRRDEGRGRHDSIFSDDDGRWSRGGERWSRGGETSRSSPSSQSGDDRGFFARAGDELRSWMGDEEAERRRERDTRKDEIRGRDPESRWESSERGSQGGSDYDRSYRSNRATLSDDPGRYSSGMSRSSSRSGMSAMDPPQEQGRRGYGEQSFGQSRSGGRQGYAQGGYGGGSEYGRGKYGQSEGHSSSGRAGRGSPWDDTYLRWREQQISKLDQEYEEYCRDCENQFSSEFEGWRNSRLTGSGTSGQFGAAGSGSGSASSASMSANPIGSDASHQSDTGLAASMTTGGGTASATESSTGSSQAPEATETAAASGESGSAETTRRGRS